MVSLKTPESPRLTRQDFASVAAYIQHLEMLVELDQMRRALNKDNRETRNLVNNLDNENEVEPEEQLGDVGEGVQDEVEEDVEDQVEENVFTLHAACPKIACIISPYLNFSQCAIKHASVLILLLFCI